MHWLKSPLSPRECSLFALLPHEYHVDEDGLVYAIFTSADDLFLAQTLLAADRFGPPSVRPADHVNTDQPAQHLG